VINILAELFLDPKETLNDRKTNKFMEKAELYTTVRSTEYIFRIGSKSILFSLVLIRLNLFSSGNYGFRDR
jgi:hypothetical protein